MNYTLTTPCGDCPFLEKHKHGYTMKRLQQFASGEFPCHKQCDIDEDGEGEGFVEKPGDKTAHCAGALLFLEKRNAPHQMMRICERIGMYDRSKLNMKAKVR